MGCGLALGVPVAVMRISPNPLLASFSWTYVNFFRAVPVLVQLIFWYNLAALYPVISLSLPFLPEIAGIDANVLITPHVAIRPEVNLVLVTRDGERRTVGLYGVHVAYHFAPRTTR